MPRRHPHLLLVAAVCAGLACSNPREEDALVCDGYGCTAGYCISDQGEPACVCGAAEKLAGLACELINPDSSEPNDTFESATELAPNQTLSAKLIPKRDGAADEDFYRFEVQEGVPYWVGLNPRVGKIRMYNASRQEKSLYFLGSDGSVPSGTWFLRVSGGSASTGGPQAYEIRMNQQPDDVPNDPAGAPELASVTSARTDYPGDVDLFRVSLLARHGYRFGANLLDHAGDVSATLVDESGNTLSDPELCCDYPFMPDADRTAYLAISAGEGPARYTPYLEDIGADEDDDTGATARPVAVGGSATGTLQSYADRDFFSFEAHAGTVYKVACQLEDGTACEVARDISSAPGTLYLPASSDGPSIFYVYAPGGAYTVSVSVFERADPGTAVGSYTIPLGTPQDGLLYPKDEDTWSWEAGALTMYRVTCQGMCDQHSVSTGAAASLVTLSSSPLVVEVTDPMKMWTSVRNDSGEETSYTLEVDEVGQDEAGPHDGLSVSGPAALELSVPKSGTISYLADEDAWRLPITSAQSYTVTVSPGVRLSIWRNGSLLASSTSGEPLSFTVQSYNEYDLVSVSRGSGPLPASYTVRYDPQ
jgi:hypothetical protein